MWHESDNYKRIAMTNIHHGKSFIMANVTNSVLQNFITENSEPPCQIKGFSFFVFPDLGTRSTNPSSEDKVCHPVKRSIKSII